ncbi:MAG: hypothetical protein NTV02_00705 [Candidatus Zambryskibacteria bacterium]|nr:hypothetical protein [Candidatus Zambryskibacteria bacterium]
MVDSLLKSDIFFVITSIAVVIVGTLFAVALIYLIRILSDVKKLSRVVRKEGENIIEDVEGLRENIKKNTIKLSDILSFGFFRKKSERKKKITNDN